MGPTHGIDRLRHQSANNVDFLRLVLAGAVASGHCYPVGGFTPNVTASLLGVPFYPRLAVCGFFFLSGFLITQSYLASPSAGRYLWRRVLRIFPGYWACLIVTAFVLGPLAALGEHRSLADYFQGGPDEALRYLRANAFLWIGQNSIRGLPASVPYPLIFNGSLWTLYTEVQCYLAIAALGLLGILRGQRRILVLSIFCALFLMNLSSHVRNDVPMLRAFYDHMLLRDVRRLEQWTFFFAGSTTYLWRERVPLDRKLFLAAFVMTALLVQAACSWTFLPHGAVRALSVLPITASYCLLWLSVRLPFENFGRHGDFSYGFYLYAFPVQQLLSLFRLNQLGFAAYLVLVVAGTFPLAVASWFLVERPCLRMKNTTFAALRGSPPSSGRAP